MRWFCWSIPALRVVSLTIGLAAACNGSALPPPSVPPTPKEARELPQASFLLYPIQDGEQLLGRAVKASADGAWTVAAERAPGCDVQVLHEVSDVRQQRRVDVTSVSTLEIGYAKLIGASAKFGRVSQADIDIHTTSILRANLRGPCGDRVIDTVYVGTGSRSLFASATREGQVGVALPVGAGVGSSAANDAKSSLVDKTSWKSPHAYGFGVVKLTASTPLEVRGVVPSFLHDGDMVTLSFETNRKAWLVVYYLDGEGRCDVLWPSNEEPAPVAEPGKPAVVPSSAEKAAGVEIRARLLGDKTKPSRETLVVYAFAEKGDFEAMKPEAGAGSADGASYAAELTNKLARVPASRWDRLVVGYAIHPSS